LTELSFWGVDRVYCGFRQKIVAVCLAVFGLISQNQEERLDAAVPGHPAIQEEAQALTEDEQFYLDKVKPVLTQHCLDCHGANPNDIRGGLTLTSRAAILSGGDSGEAVDLEDLAGSLLLQAVNYEVYEMPPAGKLPQSDIDILTQWVRLGLPIPAEEEREVSSAHQMAPRVNEETKGFWSFQPVQRPPVPAVDPAQIPGWAGNEIDAFIWDKLAQANLRPAPPASRQQLVRRAYYDLIGLPPTSQQVQQFLTDESPEAFARLVDQLLESPHYGEKWGRHWLDLVRYAESNSFERDGTKPHVWRYRDYVIQSFNQDKPYDRFLREQLAGDELDGRTAETLIATGYYRLGAWDDEPADPLQAKYDELDDIIGITSQTMLGLTVNCARCHDHKIDPIPIEDYYQFAAFFENIRRYGNRSHESVEAASVMQIQGAASLEQQQRHALAMERNQATLSQIEDLVKPDFEAVEFEEFSYPENRIRLVEKRVDKLITQEQLQNYRRAFRRLAELRSNPPGSIKALVVKEEGTQPAASFVRVRGNAAFTGKEVQPRFLSILSPPEPEWVPDLHEQSSGRRAVLANWIASPENPLTARVMVNRIWQHHFGRGLVRSTSDFGFQGTPPTHPELLDWLAAEFVEQGWSIKQMHRLMMNSQTYQMSGQFDESAYQADPENELLWRFNLRRLTAEEIRDSILAVTGDLNLESMFGPSVFVDLPAEVLAGQSMPGSGWGKSSERDQRRRSIYIHIKRSLPVPILAINDAAETDSTCPVRFITTQPTQSLTMLNSEFTNHQASHFADAVMNLTSQPAEQVAEILQRVLQRQATEQEIEQGVSFMQQLQERESLNHQQALQAFCLLALNLNEFVYVD
jgi:mono/diheme cytochrome c family protein